MAVTIINKNEKIRYCTCTNCQTDLIYTDADVEDYGRGECVVCPNCNENVFIGKRIKPATFPDSFFHYGVHDGAAVLSHTKTQEYVDQVVNFLKQSPENTYSFAGSGDTYVFGMRFEDDKCINVIVAKNYWEDTIEFSELGIKKDEPIKNIDDEKDNREDYLNKLMENEPDIVAKWNVWTGHIGICSSCGNMGDTRLDVCPECHAKML